MLNVTEKSTGFLIDELITVSQKLWHLQDTMVEAPTDSERARAAEKVQILNVRRNALINAIDMRFGESANPSTIKTYENVGR